MTSLEPYTITNKLLIRALLSMFIAYRNNRKQVLCLHHKDMLRLSYRDIKCRIQISINKIVSIYVHFYVKPPKNCKYTAQVGFYVHDAVRKLNNPLYTNVANLIMNIVINKNMQTIKERYARTIKVNK